MLKKVLAKKLDKDRVEALVQSELSFIESRCLFKEVYLFGSAARGEMTDFSDLDFLVVCRNEADLKYSKQNYYLHHHGNVWPVDIIFVTAEEYEKRSKTGGVCMVCKQEGRLLKSEAA